MSDVTTVNLRLVWTPHFPIVKRLWSPSYVLVSGGFSAIALAALYWLIDVAGFRRWCTPFLRMGDEHYFVDAFGRETCYIEGDVHT